MARRHRWVGAGECDGPLGGAVEFKDRYGWAPHVPVLAGPVGRGAQRTGPDADTVRRFLGRVPATAGRPAPGADLVAAITQFQKSNGLTVDGRMDVLDRAHARLSQLQPAKLEWMAKAVRPAADLPEVLQTALDMVEHARTESAGGTLPDGAARYGSPLAMADKHFRVRGPDLHRGLDRMGVVLQAMADAVRRPVAGPWGPHLFEPDPFQQLGYDAYATAGGVYYPGQWDGWRRLDRVYLCDSSGDLGADEREALLIHELAHFAGHPSAPVLDYGYGTSDHPDMQVLTACQRQSNAETFQNFVFEANYGRERY